MTGPAQNKGRRPDRAAFVIAVFLAGFGALLIWQGWVIEDKGGYAGIGSGDTPVAIGVGLIGLAIWHVLTGLREAAPLRAPQQIAPLVWIIAGLGLQLGLLHVTGFSIASGLLFACTAAAFGKRNLALTVPIGILFAFAVYGVFDQLLQLNLPAGLPETMIYGG